MEQKHDDLDLEDEEGQLEHVSRSAEDREFDAVVSALEEVVMDDGFQELQNSFCLKHCDKFEESKENKLEYTPLHHEYCDLLESMIENKLKQRIPGYTMAKMDSILRAHKHELAGEAFDVLSSIWDFLEFKDMMLSYKGRGGGAGGGAGGALDLSVGPMGLDLSITGHHVFARKYYTNRGSASGLGEQLQRIERFLEVSKFQCIDILLAHAPIDINNRFEQWTALESAMHHVGHRGVQ